MSRLVIVLAVLQQVLGLYCSFGFPRYHHGGHISEPVSVHDVSPTMPPEKPLDRLMPEDLHFHISGQHNKAFKLRLKRWDHQDKLIPVYRFKEGKLEEVRLPDMSSAAGLYQGTHSDDLFLVHATANSNKSNFSLHGVFSKAGKQYELAPSQVGYANVAYTVRELEQLNFGGDMLYPPADVATGGKTTAAPRVRRQATGVRYVELSVFTDYQLYQRFLKFANGNAALAQSQMTKYYKYVVASMDRRYQSITTYFPKLKVRVLMSSLTICDDPTECTWSKDNVIPSTEKIVYSKALTQFRDFILGAKLPTADHMMFFTGYQMAKPDGTTGNIGISYVGSMCTDWSVSMIQERYSGTTAGVSAHELGHSLGAFHDDNKAYTGCSNQHYVMNSVASFPTAPNLASRPYIFSNCSANSIAEYLKGTRASCTTNLPSSQETPTPPAGQHFNADAQCAIYNGVGSKFCRKEQKERGFQTMCARMACSLPSNPASCSDIVPQDRTSCGDAQWCVDDICVSDKSAPKKPKDCPQGDDPTAGCSAAKCKGDALSLTLCCQTCS